MQAKSALQKTLFRGEALETPRPFDYKLLHFNPLLENHANFNTKNTSAIRTFHVNIIPRANHCSHPKTRPNWDTPQAGLAASPPPVRATRERGWPTACPCF